MSRTRNAAVGSVFAYSQYAVALVSGFFVFPLTIRHIGAYDNGLWLMTGEVVGYLLLSDLGVYAVLPWLVAAKDGAGERSAIGRCLADALALGVMVGAGFAAVAGGVWYMTPEWFGLAAADLEKIQSPLAVVLLLTGIGFPLRAFQALLGGLQDVTFVGSCALGQAAGTVALTALLVGSGFGLPGLALAAGLPPLVVGLASAARTFARFPDVTGGWHRPTRSGCGHLIQQGIGAWLGSFGVRLLMASNGLVFAALGRPDWATVYAATGKLAQVGQPACWVIPDSGLVGLSQVYGENQALRTRRTVLCLLLLYLLLPGAAAIGLLVANPWFVQAWLGSGFYAGDYVSGLLAINLVTASLAGGLFKVAGVVGYRVPIGLAGILGGLMVVGLGYGLGHLRGQAGVAEASLLVSLAVLVPLGLCMLARVFRITVREFLTTVVGPWAVRALALMALAAWAGSQLQDAGLQAVAVAAAGLLAGYFLVMRPLVGRIAWPAGIQRWLCRLRLVRPQCAPAAIDGVQQI